MRPNDDETGAEVGPGESEAEATLVEIGVATAQLSKVIPLIDALPQATARLVRERVVAGDGPEELNVFLHEIAMRLASIRDHAALIPAQAATALSRVDITAAAVLRLVDDEELEETPAAE